MSDFAYPDDEHKKVEKIIAEEMGSVTLRKYLAVMCDPETPESRKWHCLAFALANMCVALEVDLDE